MTFADIDLSLSLGGLIAGIIVGLTGMGGAALVTPMLVLVFGINPASTRTERMVSLSKTRARDTFGDESRWEEMLTGLPFGRPIEPDEIARAIAFLASPACGYVSGAVLDIDGGGAFR